jgi:hypothetical protein
MALTAYGLAPPEVEGQLALALDRNIRHGIRPMNLALLCLAAKGNECPLVSLSKKASLRP